MYLAIKDVKPLNDYLLLLKFENQEEKIFDVTGGREMFEIIEYYSEKKAKELGLDFKKGEKDEYFNCVFNGE